MIKSLARRRRCLDRLEHVDIPDPWDVNVFRQRLAQRRGRPQLVLPVPAMAGAAKISGAWIPLPDADVIFINRHACGWHGEHCYLHECGHMIMNHTTGPAEGVWQFLPDKHWDSEVVAGALLRSRYDTPVELEAEMVAGLIERRVQGQVGARRAALDLTAPAEVREVLGRLARALGVPEQ